MHACAQTEKEKADDLAQQMAKQAEQLVAERAEMAARNAALARENAQLMARLEFLEEAAAAAAPDRCGDGASSEELGLLHQALQRCAHAGCILFHLTLSFTQLTNPGGTSS